MKGNPCKLLVESELVQPLWKKLWRFFKKLKLEPPYNPAAPHLGMYPKEMKQGCLRKIYIPMYIAALFTIAKIWQQAKCPSIVKWIIFFIHAYIHTH